MSMADWFNRNFGLGNGFVVQAETLYNMAPKPKPRLVAINNAPTREEFASWRDDPATLFVFAALRNAAAEQKAAWEEISWHGGDADAKLLQELRVRADAYEALEAGDYEAFCEWGGVTPEPLEDGNNAA